MPGHTTALSIGTTSCTCITPHKRADRALECGGLTSRIKKWGCSIPRLMSNGGSTKFALNLASFILQSAAHHVHSDPPRIRWFAQEKKHRYTIDLYKPPSAVRWNLCAWSNEMDPARCTNNHTMDLVPVPSMYLRSAAESQQMVPGQQLADGSGGQCCPADGAGQSTSFCWTTSFYIHQPSCLWFDACC